MHLIYNCPRTCYMYCTKLLNWLLPLLHINCIMTCHDIITYLFQQSHSDFKQYSHILTHVLKSETFLLSDDCITYLTEQATELGLPIKVHIDNPKKPVVIITWEGKVPTSPSILLNSHMDVVPVFPVCKIFNFLTTFIFTQKHDSMNTLFIFQESWTYPPFSAHLTEDGKIYARGSQDMKCVAIQYIETVRRLKKNGVRLNRTIHLCFVPGLYFFL